MTAFPCQVRIEDLKPAGFRRLLHFIYNSRCLSWKIEEPEEWWSVLEAANKFLNSRLVEQVMATEVSEFVFTPCTVITLDIRPRVLDKSWTDVCS